MSENSFDSMIEKYTCELLDMGIRFNHPATSEPSEESAKTTEEILQQDEEQPKPEEQELPEENMYTRELFNNENQAIENISTQSVPEIEVPDPDPENFALFRAVVFTANGAFPVENAKVIVRKNGELHAFLSTNGSGETKTVKLESYPEKNSLDPDSKQQYMKYTADIYAEGFEILTDLPVEAVGGSQLLLEENLIPSGGIL